MPVPSPPVVRAATAVIVVAAVLTIVEAVSTLQNVGSVETVTALNQTLSMSWAKSSHLSITTLQDTLRVSAYVAALLAAAAGVLGFFAGRGSRESRTGLTVLAVPVLAACLLGNALAGIGVLIGTGMLWSRNAAPWFRADSEPVPASTPASASSSAVRPYPDGVPTPPMPPVSRLADRPPRVTAAGTVAIVLSAIATLGGVVGGFALVGLRNRPDERQRLITQLHDLNLGVSSANLDRYLTAAAIAAGVVAVLGLLGITAGVLTLQGSPQARVVLMVLSAVCALVSLIVISSVVSLVWFIGSVWVLAGLGSADSAAWFRRR